jgi:hypothetical protein
MLILALEKLGVHIIFARIVALHVIALHVQIYYCNYKILLSDFDLKWLVCEQVYGLIITVKVTPAQKCKSQVHEKIYKCILPVYYL